MKLLVAAFVAVTSFAQTPGNVIAPDDAKFSITFPASMPVPTRTSKESTANNYAKTQYRSATNLGEYSISYTANRTQYTRHDIKTNLLGFLDGRKWPRNDIQEFKFMDKFPAVKWSSFGASALASRAGMTVYGRGFEYLIDGQYCSLQYYSTNKESLDSPEVNSFFDSFKVK